MDAALEALKRIGVIWTELRTIIVKGQRMSNTMYIGLNAKILLAISTPMVLQTDSYTSGEVELSANGTIAMGLQRDTNTEITRKITQKKRSRAAAGKSQFSAKQIKSQTVRDAISTLSPDLQQDACQIAHEEAKAGDEVIASNFQLMASRKDLTGGLLRSAVRNDYAAAQRKQMSDQEATRQKNLAKQEAIEHQRTVDEKEQAQAAREWCTSNEGKRFLQMFETLPEPMPSEADREPREGIQREKFNQQRQDLLNAGHQKSPHDFEDSSQMSTNVTCSQ